MKEIRSYKPAEKNHGVGEQELLAVVQALAVWRCYLEGFPGGVQVLTDHARTQHLPADQARSVMTKGSLV